MFEREHHRRIATILGALDAALPAANACLFGGGTAMALRYGEYRESADIGFVVSSAAGYRHLRQLLTGPDGVRAIEKTAATAAATANTGQPLTQVREMRADQYGIRTLLRVDNIDINFEIVLEARIGLDAPGADDHLCGVAFSSVRTHANRLSVSASRPAVGAVAAGTLRK